MGDIVYESVPRVRKRDGDSLLSGANNALILLGRDRPGKIDSGYGDSSGAGTIHAVVGRSSEDMSLRDDSASVYISMKTDPDANLGINFGSRAVAVSAVISRADCIRVSSRRDLKLSAGSSYITIEDGRIVLDGEISLGEGAAERLLKGETFVRYYMTHTHGHPMGPTTQPIQPLGEDVYSARPVKIR